MLICASNPIPEETVASTPAVPASTNVAPVGKSAENPPAISAELPSNKDDEKVPEPQALPVASPAGTLTKAAKIAPSPLAVENAEATPTTEQPKAVRSSFKF